MDHFIQARRPDMIVINKKRNMAQVIDFAIAHDSRVDSKEIEEIPRSSMRTEKVVGHEDSGNSDSNRSARNYPK